jgi:penicillin-binding protein-related factor A (putative recombinase)
VACAAGWRKCVAATLEGKVKDKVKAVLKRHKAYYHMVVQNGMGCPSLDFIGCYHGRFFAIETKAGHDEMTPRQAETARQMTEAGATVFLINAVSGLPELEAWLESE